LPNATANRAFAALAFAAALVPSALAQTLYKWIDAEGKTQYSDKPPKAFKGEVTRIEPEFDKPIQPPGVAPAGAPPATPLTSPEKAKAAPPNDDVLTRRRAIRAQLEARLSRARASVDAAKKALTDTESPEPEERQTVQQRSAGGGMHGMTPRSNCRTEVGKDGRKGVMCPTSVPTTEYHDRVARQEETLRKAEEELAAAEEAWRRGVD
jgi:hypothetical protein